MVEPLAKHETVVPRREEVPVHIHYVLSVTIPKGTAGYLTLVITLTVLRYHTRLFAY